MPRFTVTVESITQTDLGHLVNDYEIEAPDATVAFNIIAEQYCGIRSYITHVERHPE